MFYRELYCIVFFIVALQLEAADYSLSMQNSQKLDSIEHLKKSGYGIVATDPSDEELQSFLAPHLKSCSLALQKKSDTAKNSVYHYKVYCQNLEVYRAELLVHRLNSKINMVRAHYPKASNSQDEYTFEDPRNLLPSLRIQDQQRILYEYNNTLNAAWKLSFYNRLQEKSQTWIVNAHTGQIYEKQKKSFHAASYGEVFVNNLNDHLLIDKELPYLYPTGKLDSDYFSVFSEEGDGSRITAADNRFPTQADNSSDLDQVQAYYAATQVVDWWKSEFNYEPTGFPIHIYVFAEFDGSSNNAFYSPFGESGSPTIRIGKGDQVNFNYLSRDNDVLNHELQHHYFYDFFAGDNEEQIMMHEFLADFFTFTMTDDPSLAESIKKDGTPLRTAILAASSKADDIDIPGSPHHLSQYLSAALWTLKQEIPNTHKLINESMKYMNQNAGLKDLFSSLLLADRDLFPLEEGHVDQSVFGQNKCLILERLLDRGFARYLVDIASENCGLNIASLAESSLARKAFLFNDEIAAEDLDEGHSCGVISTPHKTNPTSSLLLLLMPLMVVCTLKFRPV